MLISERTAKKLRGTYRLREVDFVVVKGKTEPVSVYEVLDWHTDQTFPNISEALPIYKTALSLYRQTLFDAAKDQFERLLELHPGDGLSKMYIERCEELLADPPPANWDGVYTMKSK
jgi:adenylate cyclase